MLPEHPYELGVSYLIRTVTFYYTGKLIGVYEQELVLEDAAWIADTGHYNECLAKGTFNEVEPMPTGRVVIGRGAVVDAVVWSHPLPRTVK